MKTTNAFAKTFYYPKEEYEKSLLYGNKKLVGEEIEFTDHLVFKELKPVTFFGGRGKTFENLVFFTDFFVNEKEKLFPTEQFQI